MSWKPAVLTVVAAATGVTALAGIGRGEPLVVLLPLALGTGFSQFASG